MSTHPELEILSSGAFASIQDGGRYGFRRIGVPWAGVLDRRLMRIANALVDNPGDAPVIECFDGGLQLAAHGAGVKLAVAGDAVVEIKGAEQTRPLAPWRSITLAEGETLRIRRMGHGRVAVVAIAGLTVPAVTLRLIVAPIVAVAVAGLLGLTTDELVAEILSRLN